MHTCIKPLDEVIRRLGCAVINNADCTQLYPRISSEPREVVKELSHGLKKVKDWMGVNKLGLSPDKMEVQAGGSGVSAGR